MPQIIDKARWLKPEAIESEAEKLVRQFEEQNGSITKPPVPVELLIEGTLGLTIDWCQIAEKPGETILALMHPQEQTIRMNEIHRAHFDGFLGSEIFTLAHEAGHWVLHVQDGSVVQLPLFGIQASRPFICRGISGDKTDSFEWQANQFAGALLMPKPLLRECASKVDVCEWRGLYRLRDEFGVSITALTRRLTEMNLLCIVDKTLYPNREAYSGQQTLV